MWNGGDICTETIGPTGERRNENKQKPSHQCRVKKDNRQKATEHVGVRNKGQYMVLGNVFNISIRNTVMFQSV